MTNYVMYLNFDIMEEGQKEELLDFLNSSFEPEDLEALLVALDLL